VWPYLWGDTGEPKAIVRTCESLLQRCINALYEGMLLAGEVCCRKRKRHEQEHQQKEKALRVAFHALFYSKRKAPSRS
jgi:hypothetical protein